ncbi:zinc transporter ZIP1 isoform X1 [Uranotaenia lowii]|uniref:zinc transporter ZIP1 isoform X1 n=1 Tax=Uranotaenia lowii TaxID=190385 RepID=UPI002479DECF|nr:zinc transporter ZIP1 isoform X1 [Uranotaenia lowii]
MAMALNVTARNLLEVVDRVMDDHDHDHVHGRVDAHEDGDSESTLAAKATAMAVLFAVSMISGCVPFKLAKWFKWTDLTNAKASLVVSILLSFGGGALLCTTFQHLLPEINHTIRELTEQGLMMKLSFSLGEFLLCAGFFTIYLVEELVHLYLHRHERRLNEAKFNELEVAGGAIMRGTNARESIIMRKKNSDIRNGSISTADLIANDLENQKRGIPANGRDSVVSSTRHPHDHHVHHHLPPTETDGSIIGNLRGLLIVLALSVHELFEGLAVGLESSPSTVWYMFGAVAAHKYVIAFCVGVELIVARTKFWMAITYIFIYSVVSPIGIGIGMLLSNGPSSDDMQVVSVILQGLASGTLLYVVFFEILSKDRSGLLQYLAVFVGFFFMFGVQFFTHGHGHSHGHGGGAGNDDDHDHDHDHDHH